MQIKPDTFITSDNYLILCPYCAEPIDEDTDICTHCKKDTRDDAAVEESVDDYLSTQPKKCIMCPNMLHPLANVCYACKQRQN